MQDDQSLSTLSLAVLGLISEQSRTGYDIRKAFATTPIGHYCTSPGAIYPALKRMDACGWIVGSTANKESLRPKKVYALTEAGRKKLKQDVSQPVTREDVMYRMDHLLLRFAFMGKLVSRQKTAKFLTGMGAEIDSYVASLKQFQGEAGKQMPLHGVLAMENGIEGYQAHSRWTRRAIRSFNR